MPLMKPSDFGSFASLAQSRVLARAKIVVAARRQDNRRMETPRVKSFNPTEPCHHMITRRKAACKLQDWPSRRHGRYDGSENRNPFDETIAIRTGRQGTAGDA